MAEAPLRILYIEDSSLDRALVREAFLDESSNFELIEATSRAEIESLLERESFDLVLSDLNNPGFSGLRVLDAVQERSPFTPVIVFTGMGSEEMAVEALKLGAADYILKNTQSLRQLPHSVRQVLERQKSELARIESERRYRALFEQSSDAIFIIDLDGKIMEVNQRAQEMLGYTPEEFCMHPVWAITADPEQSKKMFAHLLQGEKSYIYQSTIQKKDGSLVQVEINAELVCNQGGNPQHIQSLIRDVSERKRVEQALSESQSQLVKAQKIAHLGNWDWDVAGETLTWSDELYRIFGVEKDFEFTSDGIAARVHPDDREKNQAFVDQILSGGDLSEIELRIIRPNGEVRHLWQHVEVSPDESGNPQRVFGTLQDITERKQVEQQLVESEEKFRKLFTEMRFGCTLQELILDESGNPIDYITFDMNPAAERLLDVQKKEILGKRISSLLPPEEFEKWLSIFQKVALSGESVEYEQYSAHNDKHFSGSTYCPQLGHFAVIFEDISEQVKAERALRESEERHRLLFENASQSIGYYDLDGRAVAFNREAARRMGGEANDLIGKSLVELFGSDQGEVILLRLKKAIALEQSQRYEDRVMLPIGDRWYLSSYTRITDSDGDVVGVQIISTDITARKQAEASLQEYSDSLEEIVSERTRDLQDAQEKLLNQERMAILGQVASGIAHELRNPLNVIDNAVYYLRSIQPQASEKVKEYLEIIGSEKQTAEMTVMDLLNFANPAQPDRETFDMRDIVQTVFEKSPPPDNIELITHIPTNTVYADRLQVIQAFTNLVLNAYQAMPEGGKLEISVQASATSKQLPEEGQPDADDSQAIGPWIRITAKDTGDGILPAHMQMLFDPLFTTRPRSIGMGLPIARKLIEANGGRIEVASQPGKGSQFSIILPTYKDKKWTDP